MGQESLRVPVRLVEDSETVQGKRGWTGCVLWYSVAQPTVRGRKLKSRETPPDSSSCCSRGKSGQIHSLTCLIQNVQIRDSFVLECEVC